MSDETYQPKVYRKQGGNDFVVASGGTLDIESGGSLEIAGTQITATAAELNKTNIVTQTLTATAAVTPGAAVLYLDHTSTTIAATIADATLHAGVFMVTAITEPGGSGDHTLTLTGGTFNGTNTIATFADIADSLFVMFDSAGKGTIILNTGSVALSGP